MTIFCVTVREHRFHVQRVKQQHKNGQTSCSEKEHLNSNALLLRANPFLFIKLLSFQTTISITVSSYYTYNHVITIYYTYCIKIRFKNTIDQTLVLSVIRKTTGNIVSILMKVGGFLQTLTQVLLMNWYLLQLLFFSGGFMIRTFLYDSGCAWQTCVIGVFLLTKINYFLFYHSYLSTLLPVKVLYSISASSFEK